MSVRVVIGLFVVMTMLTGWPSGAGAATELLVSAAASLTESFKEIGQAYMAKNPRVTVRFNFGASGSLLQQIEQGAPVDLFASADQQSMDQAERGGFIRPASRTDFIGNSLVLITPLHMTAVKGVADLQSGQVHQISMGNPASVPAGRYARAALDKLGIGRALAPKYVMGSSVKQALEYVLRQEVEAAFVFGSDAVLVKERIRLVTEIPTVTPIVYPVAVVAASGKQEEALAFIRYLQGAAAQNILAGYGFKKRATSQP